MSLEAEQAINACCLGSTKAYDMVSQDLFFNDFSDDLQQLIYKTITVLRESGRNADVITVGVILEGSDKWKNLTVDEPVAYLSVLAASSTSFHSLKEYIQIVKRARAALSLVDACASIYELTQDAALTPDELLAQAAMQLPHSQQKSEAQHISAAYRLMTATVQRRASGETVGIPSGYANLDKIILGFEKGTLNIVAGRPSMGKTVVSMDIAHEACKHGQVQFYSLEMPAEQLAMRSMASIASVDFGKLRKGELDDHMIAAMSHNAKEAKAMNIYIDDQGGLPIHQLMSRARIQARKEAPAMIIVDYLQLVNGRGNSLVEQIGDVSRSLKLLAKDLECPVVCLAQLNRGLESRPDKRPMNSDLKGSGDIEQDADVIIFVYRDDVYHEDSHMQGMGELIVSKQRNGELDTALLEFQGRYQRFVDFKGERPQAQKKEKKAGRKSIDDFVGSNKAPSNSAVHGAGY